MKETVKLKMLLIISNGGSIRELLREGYTYSQIAEMTNILIEDNLIEEADNYMVLSDNGKKWLDATLNENKLKSQEKWITPEERSRTVKLKENEVYLPNRNELHF